MRHGKKIIKLGRKSAHRKAMLANMAVSLFEHKRITTTSTKAKALKIFVEPLITKSKNDTVHNRRICFSKLRNKHGVKILFDEISKKVADRPGGYTRVIKLGNRLGDNASMAMIELVDFNDIYNSISSNKSEVLLQSQLQNLPLNNTLLKVINKRVYVFSYILFLFNFIFRNVQQKKKERSRTVS